MEQVSNTSQYPISNTSLSCIHKAESDLKTSNNEYTSNDLSSQNELSDMPISESSLGFAKGLNLNCENSTMTQKGEQLNSYYSKHKRQQQTELSRAINKNSYPSCIFELQQLYSSVLDFEGITQDLLEHVGNEIIRLTTVWQGKCINTLNKQFQNSVMNYFLECYVSDLLVNDYQVEFKRDVFKLLTAKMEHEEGSQLKRRYITLLNYFLDALQENKKIGKYVELLLNIIHDPVLLEKDTIDYQTQYRKKMTAILLLEHCLSPDRKTKFTEFYSLWSNVFTFHPLKRKKQEGKYRIRSSKKCNYISRIEEFSSKNKTLTVINKKSLTRATIKELTTLPSLENKQSFSAEPSINSSQKFSQIGMFFETRDHMPCSQQSLTLLQISNKNRSETEISPLMFGGSQSIMTQNQLDQLPHEERAKASSGATQLSSTFPTKQQLIKHEDDYSNSFTPVECSSLKSLSINLNKTQINNEQLQSQINSQNNSINNSQQLLLITKNEKQRKGQDFSFQTHNNETVACFSPDLRKQIKSEEKNASISSQNLIQEINTTSFQQFNNQNQQLLQPQITNNLQQRNIQQNQMLNSNIGIGMQQQQMINCIINQQNINQQPQFEKNSMFIQNQPYSQTGQQLQQTQQFLNQLNQQQPQQQLIQLQNPQPQQLLQQNQLFNSNFPINLSSIQQQLLQQQKQQISQLQSQQQQNMSMLSQVPTMQKLNQIQNQQNLNFQINQQQFQQTQQSQQQQWQQQQQQQQSQIIHDPRTNEIIVLNPQTKQYIRYQPKQEQLNMQGNHVGIQSNQQKEVNTVTYGPIAEQNSSYGSLQFLQQQQQKQMNNQFYN